MRSYISGIEKKLCRSFNIFETRPTSKLSSFEANEDRNEKLKPFNPLSNVPLSQLYLLLLMIYEIK